MDIREIRYFRAIAEHGNFSKAAAHLRVAQPALSRTIQKLEHDLKVRLFARTSKGVTLTSAGSVLLEQTARIEKELEQIRRSMAEFADGVTGRVRVGMQAPLSIILAPKLAHAYRERHPEVKIEFVEAGSGDITERLLEEQLDIAIVDPPRHEHADLLAVPLWSEQLFLVGRPAGVEGFPFPEGPISIDVLQNLPMVMSSDRHAIRRLIDAAFTREHRKFRPVIEADGPLTLISMIREGLGYSILPSVALHAGGSADIFRTEPIAPPILRTVAIMQRRVSHTEKAVVSLVGLIKEMVTEMVNDGGFKGVSLYR